MSQNNLNQSCRLSIVVLSTVILMVIVLATCQLFPYSRMFSASALGMLAYLALQHQSRQRTT